MLRALLPAAVHQPDRNRSLDLFRAIAITTVLLVHTPYPLPYGYLGVDLFFVLSGLLVSRPLLRDYQRKEPLRWGEFALRRATKIFPSYYFFLAFGLLLSWALSFKHMPWPELPSYIFFYQNFTAATNSAFSHLWSICVEEHFYIYLPLMVTTVALITGYRKQWLIAALVGSIFACIGFKIYAFGVGKTVWGSTHYRIDSLCFGVLIACILELFPNWRPRVMHNWALAVLGLLVAATGLALSMVNDAFKTMFMYTSISFGFALMIMSTHDMPLPRLAVVQALAYYSYNLYLWHHLMRYIFFHRVGPYWLEFTLYLGVSFAAAVLATKWIEEPALTLRKRLLPLRQPQPVQA